MQYNRLNKQKNMEQTKITAITEFNHLSETVQKHLNYLIKSFKPTETEPLFITEFNNLDDPGNEYAFLLQFNQDPENTSDDLTEEIPAYLSDMPGYCQESESDFAISSKYDYTNTSHFILLTFAK